MKNIGNAVSILKDMEYTGVQNVYGVAPGIMIDALELFGMPDELREVSEHFGYNIQSLKLVEEMAEAGKEIVKLKIEAYNQKSMEDRRNKLIEELADVTIVLQQVIHQMDAEDDVAKVRKEKIAKVYNIVQKEKALSGQVNI